MNNPLKKWRDDRKLSQVELGDLIGVDGMTISRWERGDHLPRKRHWLKIEEATGIAPSELIDHVKPAGEPEVAQ
jgi:transcriptional regulator with XRE-family HTH domain